MSYREVLPHPRLEGLVRAYWQLDEFHDLGQQEHRFLPERLIRLIFFAGDSWQGPPTTSALERMPKAALIGLTLQPLRVVSRGRTRAFGVELYPWGARQLFGWTFGVPDLDLSVNHPSLTRAVCALIAQASFDEARQMTEDWLLALLRERGRPLNAGAQAAARLYRSCGSLRIGTLAEELGFSQRHLERQFVQEVGVNAKTLARLIRFEETHNRLWLDPHTPLAPLAYELGFADQSHLSREFRALSDMTPGAFARHSLLRLRVAENTAEQGGAQVETRHPGLPPDPLG